MVLSPNSVLDQSKSQNGVSFIVSVRPVDRLKSTQNIAQTHFLEQYVQKMLKIIENGPVVLAVSLFKL